jgi:hypothetical protein
MQVELALPKNLKEIGNYAFYNGGNNIKIVNLPENLLTIGSWAFAYCTNIGIQNFNIKSMGDAAFYNCGRSNDNLITKIILGPRVEQLAQGSSF